MNESNLQTSRVAVLRVPHYIGITSALLLAVLGTIEDRAEIRLFDSLDGSEPYITYNSRKQYERGWPWTWVHDRELSLSLLIADSAVWIALGLLVGTLCERRARYRRFGTFTIREGMVLIASCAFTVWIGAHIFRARLAEQRAIADVENAGFLIEYEYRGPLWLRRLVGRPHLKHFWRVVDVEPFDMSDETVFRRHAAQLGQFREWKVLSLAGEHITGATLDDLSRTCSFREILLSETHVDDAGLTYLSRFLELKRVKIEKCPITDESLRLLADLPGLEELSLEEVTITLSGLASLYRAPRLAKLRVYVDTDCAWGDDLVTVIAGMKHLRYLAIGCISNDARNLLAKIRPDLTVVTPTTH